MRIISTKKKENREITTSKLIDENDINEKLEKLIGILLIPTCYKSNIYYRVLHVYSTSTIAISLKQLQIKHQTQQATQREQTSDQSVQEYQATNLSQESDATRTPSLFTDPLGG